MALSFTCLPLLPAGAQRGSSDVRITPAEREAVLDSAAGLLRRLYVDSAMGQRMSDTLRVRRSRGTYAEMRTGPALAQALTADLRRVSRDLHIVVEFDSSTVPADTTPMKAPSGAPARSEEAYANFGFDRVERLAGNVGYLRSSLFVNPAESGATLAAVMTFLERTDALIIDLRSHDGGSPNMVNLLCSYFVDTTAQLSGIFTRATNRVSESRTIPFVGGPRYLGRPVYLLTSRTGTTSAAEGFAYNMKVMGRATLVGDTTYGAANPGSTRSLGGRFTLFVPTGRAVHPLTGTNWEGVGVAPDVVVPEARALDVAHERALAWLLQATQDPARRRALEQLLDRRRSR